mgnify:CR=1 FL=1
MQVEKITQNKNLSAKEKNELISEISSVFDDNELDYARKLYLIENCIHGIDIQPIEELKIMVLPSQSNKMLSYVILVCTQTRAA